MRCTSAAPQSGLVRPGLSPVNHPHRVAAGLLVRPQNDEPALLALGQQIVERPEPIGALVEAWMTSLDRLFDHRAPDGFTAALLGQRFQSLDDPFPRIAQGFAPVVAML